MTDSPPPPSPSAPAHDRATVVRAHFAPGEAKALGTLAILAALAIVWVILPVGIGVLVGGLLAFTAHQPYRGLVRHLKRPALAAFILAAGTSLTVAGAAALLAYLLILQGLKAATALPGYLGPDGGVARLAQQLRGPLGLVGIDPATVPDRVRHALGGLASQLAGWAAGTLGAIFEGALAVFFMALTMYFVLVHWADLARRAERMLPFNPRHTRHLLKQLRRLGRTVVIGNFGTALVQGLLGGIGYAIAHVPEAALLGALTAVASLVPAIGTMLVWIPAGVLVIAAGHTTAGIFELGWGALMTTAFCDYVVRPKLVGRGAESSTWLTFVSLFGGIKLFGAVGVLLGPLLVGFAIAALRVYERVRRFRLSLP